MVRFCLGKARGGDAGACGFCLGKTRGGDAGACVFGKTRGGDAGSCGKVIVLAKLVAVTQVLVVRFLSWQNAWR